MIRSIFACLVAAVVSVAPMSASAAQSSVVTHAHRTQLTWYGHSAFKVVTPAGHVLYIDPWLQNPKNPDGAREVAAIDHADLLLISHGHFDHVGEAVQIAKRTHAKVVAPLELGDALVHDAGLPKDSAGYDSLGNFGGTLPFFGGEVAITIVPAVHSSSVNPKALGASNDDADHAAGNPAGFIIAIRNGPVLYHTGDTALYGDMAQLAAHHVDVMLTCIGGHFTMDPADAAKAVDLVEPKIAIPMHYGTFPILTGTPEEFAADLRARRSHTKALILNVGSTIAI